MRVEVTGHLKLPIDGDLVKKGSNNISAFRKKQNSAKDKSFRMTEND